MEKILMGGIVAFTVATLVSYFLLAIHAPYLIIPIVIAAMFFLAKPLVKTLRSIKIKPNLFTLAVILVFITGITGQMAIISPSGSFNGNGDLLFWSSNGHDGAWHIALMEQMKNGWPLQNPVFAGEKLVNYHFFSDVLPAMVGKCLPISDLNLYFKVFPFIYSLFLGSAAYFLTKKLTGKSIASLWATIFTYFAGSFGYIATYIKNKTIGGESIFWASQPQSASGNPPQIISDFLILSGLYFLVSLMKQKNKSGKNVLFVICVIIFGSLVSFKVYAGIVGLISLGLTGLWQFFKEKKINILVLTFLSGILSAILYFPNSAASASFLIFQPWWYIRTMVVDSSRLNWIDLELRRQFYLARGGIRSVLRILEYEGVAFVIFFFGNLGMRFLGLKKLLKTHPFIKFAVILSFIAPLLFLQKGVASNTSQFLQYFILFFGILAGIQVSELGSRYKILIPVIILLMVPTQAGLIWEFYSHGPYAMVSKGEITALGFIKDNTSRDTVVVTPPYNQYLDLGGSVPNIWDWFDTSYVSALSGRKSYFDDYEQVDIMGYDWRGRLQTKKEIFESTDPVIVKEAFSETGATLLYYPKQMAPKVDPSTIGFESFFMNEAAEVWKAN